MGYLKGKRELVVLVDKDLVEQAVAYRKVTGRGPSDIIPELMKEFFQKEAQRFKDQLQTKEAQSPSKATKTKHTGEEPKK